MPAPIATTLYTDPGCPWGYSVLPALRLLEWRYGAQLEWRLVLIGLTERAEQYVARGYTTLGTALGQRSFRRFGMPFAPEPKARVSATARACRAIVAARILRPGSEWEALRALQIAQFTTPLVLDDDERVAAVVAAAVGLEPDAVQDALDDDGVGAAYERDRAEARTAAGSPAELQGKTAATDGPVRFTAPSVVFERDGRRLVAGGWQPAEAYDVLVANLDPTLIRRGAPADASELLAAFPGGVTTQEAAVLLAVGNDAPDPVAAEGALLGLVADGRATRVGVGDDAVWTAPERAEGLRAVLEAATRAPTVLRR